MDVKVDEAGFTGFRRQIRETDDEILSRWVQIPAGRDNCVKKSGYVRPDAEIKEKKSLE